MSNYARISLVISLLATIFYCVVVWYGGNLFVILVGQNSSENIPNFSVWTILPVKLSLTFNMIHWQLLALASYLLSLIMTLKGAEHDVDDRGMALPLVNHYGVLLLLTFINITGFAISFVAVCSELR